MKKKIILSLIVLLTVALLFTGCSLLDGMFGTIDGTWIGSFTDDTGSKPYTMYSGKLVISGNTAKLYSVSGSYKAEVVIWSIGGQNGPAPEVTWDTASIPGTVTQNGSSLKIDFNGYVMNATLSSDKKSFTYTDNLATYTYKKQ